MMAEWGDEWTDGDPKRFHFPVMAIVFSGHSFLIDPGISSRSCSQSNTLTFLFDISPTSQWTLQHETIDTSRLFVPLALNEQWCSINRGSSLTAICSSSTVKWLHSARGDHYQRHWRLPEPQSTLSAWECKSIIKHTLIKAHVQSFSKYLRSWVQ